MSSNVKRDMLEIRSGNGEVSSHWLRYLPSLMLAVACQYIDFKSSDEKCPEPVYFLLTQTAKIDFVEKQRLHLWFWAILPTWPGAGDRRIKHLRSVNYWLHTTDTSDTEEISPSVHGSLAQAVMARPGRQADKFRKISKAPPPIKQKTSIAQLFIS